MDRAPNTNGGERVAYRVLLGRQNEGDHYTIGKTKTWIVNNIKIDLGKHGNKPSSFIKFH
jgi:hypothetical protein